jgi:hypothetical protein
MFQALQESVRLPFPAAVVYQDKFETPIEGSTDTVQTVPKQLRLISKRNDDADTPLWQNRLARKRDAASELRRSDPGWRCEPELLPKAPQPSKYAPGTGRANVMELGLQPLGTVKLGSIALIQLMNERSTCRRRWP